jgi:hypothetical protein
MILLLGVSSVHAYECYDFESKIVQHSVEDLFCVTYDTKLTPLQMDGQYSMVVEQNKLTDKYDHKVVFKTKGVLLFKSPTNEIMTVEVIDPAEKEAWTEMQFTLEAQDRTIQEKDRKIANMTLENEKIKGDYLVTKSELENAKWFIAENQTAHDCFDADEKDLKRIYREVENEKSKWRGRANFLLAVLGLLTINWIRAWARSNRQDGYSER